MHMNNHQGTESTEENRERFEYQHMQSGSGRLSDQRQTVYGDM